MSTNDISSFITSLVKQLNEKPIAVFTMLCISALIFIYSDMQTLNHAQVTYMRELTVALKEIIIRIGELEEWHRLEYNKLTNGK